MAEDTAAARTRLAADLRAAGVREGCPLLIHTSLSAVGRVPGGASTVIGALLDAVGPSGSLVIPTLSYLYTNAETPTFDVRKTPTNLGTIPETFRLMPGVARSMHPTHSCAAIGPHTLELLGEHRHDRSPVGKNSPFRRVRDLEGQVAFLGVPHVRALNGSVLLRGGRAACTLLTCGDTALSLRRRPGATPACTAWRSCWTRHRRTSFRRAR
jgi:aminoglycoside N3'-acetyltransferase